MKTVLGEFTAKTVEEAKAAALAALEKSENEVEFEVLDEGKVGGFLGFGARNAKVKVYQEVSAEQTEEVTAVSQEKEVSAKKPVTPIESVSDGKDGARAVEFLKGLLEILEIDASPVLTKEEEKIEITLEAENTHQLIGKHGAMLDAIQNLAGAVANIGRENYKRVVVDCDGYREYRDKTLAHVAEKTAAKALRLGKKVGLEPMSAYERRIIHSTLADRTDVKTISEGKEPRRHVVVVPTEVRTYNGNRGGFNRDRDNRGGFNRDRNGNRGGFNRDNRGGFNREFNRDRDNRGGFNRDRNGGRDFKKPYRQYTEEEKRARSQVSGGTGMGGSNSDNAAYKKNSSVVFGTYLGNSRKNEENNEN
ncbi:MAG: Jag N-terminal domain-containing protein [Clostridia bacterium]|nr:Jag N-terminal domain-containing protein [Clostridia bacterium]